jgi:hypothetical protein
MTWASANFILLLLVLGVLHDIEKLLREIRSRQR